MIDLPPRGGPQLSSKGPTAGYAGYDEVGDRDRAHVQLIHQLRGALHRFLWRFTPAEYAFPEFVYEFQRAADILEPKDGSQ